MFPRVRGVLDRAGSDAAAKVAAAVWPSIGLQDLGTPTSAISSRACILVDTRPRVLCQRFAHTLTSVYA